MELTTKWCSEFCAIKRITRDKLNWKIQFDGDFANIFYFISLNYILFRLNRIKLEKYELQKNANKNLERDEKFFRESQVRFI